MLPEAHRSFGSSGNTKYTWQHCKAQHFGCNDHPLACIEAAGDSAACNHAGRSMADALIRSCMSWQHTEPTPSRAVLTCEEVDVYVVALVLTVPTQGVKVPQHTLGCCNQVCYSTLGGHLHAHRHQTTHTIKPAFPLSSNRDLVGTPGTHMSGVPARSFSQKLHQQQQ